MMDNERLSVSIERERSADIKAKIRALIAKTTAAGCTEAEALAAAAKAQQLMAEHGLSDDLVSRPPIVKVNIDGPLTLQQRPWISVWLEIAERCHVRIWFGGSTITYCGFEPDALVAEYMHSVLLGCVQRARAAFRTSAEYRRRRTKKTKAAATSSYIDGYVLGLLMRFRTTMGATPVQEDGGRLALIDQHTSDMKFGRHKIRDRARPRNENAALAGTADGRNAQVNFGVGGTGPAPKLIGRG